MHASVISPFVLTTLLLLAACETYPPSQGGVVVHTPDSDVRIVFSDRDRGLIRDYYAVRAKPLPPGLAKKNKVPPGHAKQMAEGRVPPGLEGRYLPADLEGRLSRLPEGYVRVIIGADVVLMNSRTRLVLDILRDVTAD